MKARSLEWQLLVLVTLALTAFGLIMVYSATSASAALGNGNPTGYHRALDAAARNVDHRGASGLADYLRGELSIK